MKINVSFDQNTGTLPNGFVAAVDYVTDYFDSLLPILLPSTLTSVTAR